MDVSLTVQDENNRISRSKISKEVVGMDLPSKIDFPVRISN